jgi:hypothetical protein
MKVGASLRARRRTRAPGEARADVIGKEGCERGTDIADVPMGKGRPVYRPPLAFCGL